MRMVRGLLFDMGVWLQTILLVLILLGDMVASGVMYLVNKVRNVYERIG